jgi:hypothetical protein
MQTFMPWMMKPLKMLAIAFAAKQPGAREAVVCF